MGQADTKQQIMTAARLRVQARGYNALSFRELAKEVGIKSASIHYHFPTKGDLGAALARSYTEDAQAHFDALSASGDDVATIFRHYVAIFRAALSNDNRMCLYGIMAAEQDDLPEEVRTQVNRFNQVNVSWLTTILLRQDPSADRDATARKALSVFSAIEGAQLVARGRGDISLYDQAIEGYRAVGLIP